MGGSYFDVSQSITGRIEVISKGTEICFDYGISAILWKEQAQICFLRWPVGDSYPHCLSAQWILTNSEELA